MKALASAVIAMSLFSFASAAPAASQSAQMNFFITSTGPGNGADLGGLAGADAHCAFLGYNAGFGDRTWVAYLNTTARDGEPAVNARDRIGTGPWYNYRGALIAESIAQLHGENMLTKETGLTDKGQPVNGRGDSPNMHDILTGSRADGTAFDTTDDTTCDNWTSSADGAGAAQVGHHDRIGGGQDPTSWNSAHASRGCSQQNLQATGGNGLFYCFAI